MRQVVVETVDLALARAIAREWNIEGVQVRRALPMQRTRVFNSIGVGEIAALIVTIASSAAGNLLAGAIEDYLTHLDGKAQKRTRIDGEPVPEEPEQRRRMLRRLLQEDIEREGDARADADASRQQPGAANDNE